VNRNEADVILDALEPKVATRAIELPDLQFWGWFSGEVRGVVAELSHVDREHVCERIDGILYRGGKYPKR